MWIRFRTESNHSGRLMTRVRTEAERGKTPLPSVRSPCPTRIPTHMSGVTWHQHDGPRKALALRGPFAFPDRHASQRNRSVLISRSAQPPRTLDAIDKPGQLCVTLAPQEAPDHAPRDGHAGPDQGMKERAVFAAVLSQAEPRRARSGGGPG